MKNIVIKIDKQNTSIVVNDVEKKCSVSEVLILIALFKSRPNTVSKDELTRKGWPGKVVTGNSVVVAIGNLRKIFRSTLQKDIIETGKDGYYISSNVHYQINESKNSEMQTTKNQSDNKLQVYLLAFSILLVFAINIYLTIKNYPEDLFQDKYNILLTPRTISIYPKEITINPTHKKDLQITQIHLNEINEFLKKNNLNERIKNGSLILRVIYSTPSLIVEQCISDTGLISNIINGLPDEDCQNEK